MRKSQSYCLAWCGLFLAAMLWSPALRAETSLERGEIQTIISPDDLHLDPDSVVVAVDVYGDEDREVNGVLFQTDKTGDDTVGLVEKDGVRVDLQSTHFIDGWAAAPAFEGGQGDSASNLGEIMRDIRWSQAPNPLTMDVSGLDAGGLYELQILVNENADRDRRWDIGVNGILAADDFSSEGTGVDDDVWAPNNSFVYKGEFEANGDGEINVVMQQHIEGQDAMGSDNNPILQAFIVHAVNTSDDDPNVLAGTTIRLGQQPSTPTQHEVRIRNSGPTQPLNISRISISGDGNANFTVVEFPETVPPDSAAVILIEFDPKSQSGAFFANLEITSNDESDEVNVITLEASVINRLGPATHLTLDETEGVELRDISGNNRNGALETPLGSATLGEPALASGTSARLTDGGQVKIGGGALGVLENFSISLWAQWDALNPAPQTVFAKGNVDTPAFALLAIDSSLGWLPADAGEAPEFIAEGVLTAGEAHHIVVVHDNNPDARKVTIYVDGAAVASQDDPLTVTDERGLALQLGSYNGGLIFNGLLDDIQVYDRALSDEEVAQLQGNPGLSLPIGNNAPVDSDGDGLVDTREAELGTDPLEPDTDEDGLNDLVEVDTHGTNPLLADSDGDGFDDPTEILTESDPNDPNSTPIDGEILVAYWDFDDASDTQNVAATVGDHTGELQGDAAFTEDGEGSSGAAGDRAMDFGVGEDGSAMLADGAFINAFALVDQMTLSYWQKLRTVTNMTSFKARSPSSSGAERGWSTHTPWGNRTIYFDTAGCCDGGTQRINQDATSVDFEAWNHFAFVKNGETKQIWINGELFLEGRNTGPLPTDFTEIWLGAALDGSESLDGMIDEFAIYQIALGETAIAKLAAGARADATLGEVDTDGDGWDDDIERSIFGDLSQTPESDKDEDGLGNLREIEETETDPNVADTDGDGISDGDEVNGNPATNPLRTDTDGDGLSDNEEIAQGTNPTLSDTDGDRFPDGFEIAEGTDPTDPLSLPATNTVVERLEIGALRSVDDLFIRGAFTHAVNIGGITEDYQVGDITFATDDPAPANIEFTAVNHIENWAAENFFGDDPDNQNLAGVVHDIRWSPRPQGVEVILKDVAPGPYRLQMLFGEKCCDRGFAVRVNGEILQVGDTILNEFSPNAQQEGDHSGTVGAYIIYEFNHLEGNEIVLDFNGADAPNPDGNAILSGVSLQIMEGTPSVMDGLVGLWQFEGDAVDGSGNGNDGTLENGAAFSDDVRDGAVGQSLAVGGGEQHVLVPHSDSLNATDALSIAAWVKPIGDMAWDGILAKSPSDDSGPNHAGNYELRIENGGRFLHFLHQQGGADDTAFHQGQASIVSADVWTHIAVTADAASGDVSFYINGELSETLAGVIAVDAFPTNGNPLYIGSRADLFTAMDGLLDDVALFNRVLSAGEIGAIMTGNFTGGGVPPVDPPDPGEADAPVIAILSGPNSIGLSFTGNAGKTYDIEYSTDLETWEVVESGLQGDINYEDTDAARRDNPAGYYRAVEN